MGSPGEPQDKAIDPTVGGLVWVRRRNGSWWPGQIIEVDENSKSFMGSPKSGTPIKLLGRDDASVDWYNLEKSKRVKPFRCGEHDLCIEKAKLAAANSNKKTVKYARREDAIIRALEIENENEKLSGYPMKPSSAASLSSKETELTDDEFSGFEGNNSSVHDVVEDPNQARPRRTPNDSEDEGVKRMRGLDDLGMGVAPTMKRKRTIVGHVHDFLKKKNRRRPLAKVLESTAMVSNEPNRSSSVVINKSDSIDVENKILGNDFGDGSESEIVGCKRKENEISSILALPKMVSSEKLNDVPLLAKRTQPPGTAPNISHQKPRADTISSGNEELNESVSTSSGTADIAEKGESKWQSKGKRNSRTSVRIRKQVSRERNSNDDDDFDYSLEEYWGWSNRRSPKLGIPRAPLTQPNPFKGNPINPLRALPIRQSHFIMNPKYGPEFTTIIHDDSEFYHNSKLYEVNVEVQAGSRGTHVPYISLMSKLTGRPVVGNPLTVDIMGEGSTNKLVREQKFQIGPKHLKSHRVTPFKSSTKLKKRAPSSKKIRKLSSLSRFGRVSEGKRKLVGESMVGPTVACVPLRVVYSRLNAFLRGVMRRRRRVVVKPKKR